MAQDPITQWEIPTPTDTTYHGWKNRPTWCVTLWLNNEPGTSEYLYGLANRKHNAPHVLADILREQVNTWWHDLVELHELPSASMWADLMLGTLATVDWDGIIDAHREID
jgi:hypothetical protein